MNGLYCRKRQVLMVFRPWVWLLLAIFFAWHPADATERGHLFRSSEYLSDPAVTPDPVATTVKTQLVKEPLSVPHHLAPPSCAALLRSADTSLELLEIALILLHPDTASLTPSLPRPPPSA